MKDVSEERTEEQKYIKSIPNKSQCERYKSNMSIITLNVNELNTLKRQIIKLNSKFKNPTL